MFQTFWTLRCSHCVGETEAVVHVQPSPPSVTVGRESRGLGACRRPPDLAGVGGLTPSLRGVRDTEGRRNRTRHGVTTETQRRPRVRPVIHRNTLRRPTPPVHRRTPVLPLLLYSDPHRNPLPSRRDQETSKRGGVVCGGETREKSRWTVTRTLNEER